MLAPQLEIVRKFISSCSDSVCFLRVPDSIINELEKEDWCVIDVSKDFLPYKPFLTVLQSDDVALDLDVVAELSYSVQKDTFLSFFKNGIADLRFDIPLANELLYEQNRFVRTIIALLEKYCKKNYLILNAQCLSSESVELIRHLQSVHLDGRFVFCFSSFNNDMEPSAIFKFEEEISNDRNYLHLISSELSISKDKTQYKTLLDLSGDEQFDAIYRSLRNNRIFMMRAQLKELALWVSENFGKFDFYEDQKRDMSLELARCLLACELVDEAILYLNDIIDTQINDMTNAIALYHLTWAFSFKKSASLAQKYYTLAEKALTEKNNDVYLALCSILDFNISRASSAGDTVVKYQKCLELLEKQGFVNNYISISISVPWKLVDNEVTRKSVDEGIDKSLELAQKIDNQHLVSSACHWKGIICSHYGEMDEALKWYDKCNEIRTEIGEIGPILNIRNGLCYDANCRAMYKRGYDLENGIIAKLYDVGDVATITDTLKNVGYALFYSRHFSEAYDVFNVISHYLSTFKMDEMLNSSFLPSLNDMLMFKTMISFDAGDYIRGRVNHANIMQNMESLSTEDRPFIYFIEAVLHVVDGEFKFAELLFKRCVEEFSEIKSKMFHKIVFAYYEFAVMLERLGYSEQASFAIRTGAGIAKEHGFSYYLRGGTESPETMTVQKYLDGIERFDPLDVSLIDLKSKAEKEQLLILLHKRIHDYQFINKVKTGNTKNMSIKQYVRSVLLDISEYTMCERIYFAAYEDNEYKCFESVSNKKTFPLAQEAWQTLFKQSKKSENAQLVYNEDVDVFFGNCSYSKYTFGIILIPSKKNPLTVEVINTVNIALSSIQSQVVIFKQEEHLMVMSSTDQLSRLKNRHAFQECISLESERVRRYQQRKETVIQIAVAFIDMDNFKFYNDTFGHNVGDLLIKSFANLLRETCRKIDFISRYGGDEFVIIMFDTNAEEGKRVFQRLRDCLISHEYFIPDIMEFLDDHTITVPENRRIGFSMGVSTNLDVENCDNLDKVVQYADKALYYSKEHGKGIVSVWSEIKDVADGKVE